LHKKGKLQEIKNTFQEFTSKNFHDIINYRVEVDKVKRIRNNRAFTLVELLATIIIIGVLSGTAVVGVSKNITKSHEKYCDSQVDMLRIAGKDYFNDHLTLLPMSIGKDSCVTLNTLINSKYIEIMKDYNNNTCNQTNTKVCAIMNTKNSYYYTTYLDCSGCNANNNKTNSSSTPKIEFSPNSANNVKNKDITVKMQLTDPEYPIISYAYKIYQVTEGGDVEVESIDFKEYKGSDIKIKLNKKGTYYIKGYAYNSKGGYKEQTSGRYNLKYTIGTSGNSGTCNGQISITAKKNDEGVIAKVNSKEWMKGSLSITVQRKGDIESYDIYIAKLNAVYKNPIDYDNLNYVKVVSKATANSRTITYPATDTGKYIVYVIGYNDQGDVCSTMADTKAGKTEFYQDNTDPSCETLGAPGRWVNYPVTLTPKCTDLDSGCDHSKSSSNTIAIEFNDLASPGRVYDNVGNYTTCPYVLVQIDMTKPVCEMNGEGEEGNNDYYVSDLYVRLTAYDPGSISSGLKGYAIDDAREAAFYEANHGKKMDGELRTEETGIYYHNRYCSAVDNAGNESDFWVPDAEGDIWFGGELWYTERGNLKYRIDKTPPTYEISLSGERIGGGYADGGILSVKCSDEGGSGVADGDKILSLSGSVVELRGFCEDMAGNQSEEYYRMLKKCASPTCGPKKCRNKACGVESYRTCSSYACGSYCSSWYDPSVGGGCASWSPYTCTHSSCGVASYRECETPACGYKDCWVEEGDTCTTGGGPTSTGGGSDDPPIAVPPSKPEKEKDKEKPKCSTYFGGNKKWKKSGYVEVGVNCIDSGSGCKQAKVTKRISNEAKTKKVSFTIEDKAGNKTTCTHEFDIYIDKTPPTISFGGMTNVNKDNYQTQCPGYPDMIMRVDGNVKDNLSGIDKSKSKYTIGPDSNETRDYPTVVGEGSKSGTDGFCSRKKSLYVRYTLCDLAGNCNNGTHSKSY